MTQFNLGKGARIAGRDFVEKAEIRRYVDDLQAMSQDQKDAEAKKNEWAFIWRFGFDANEEQRAQVLALKRAAKLTDLQIRLLERTDNLKIKGGVRLVPARWVKWVGWIQINAVVGFFGLLLAAVLVASNNSPIVSLLVELCLGAMAIGFAKLYHWMYVKPWHVIQSARLTLEADKIPHVVSDTFLCTIIRL